MAISSGSAKQIFTPERGITRKDNATMKRALPVLLSIPVLVLLPLLAGRPLAAQATPEAARANAPQITGTIDESNLLALHGNTHPLARAEFDRGAADGGMKLSRMLLVLRRTPQQEADLQRLIGELHDPNSSRYHQWLTPEQFGARFGPAQADIDTIVHWLQTHGFRVTGVAAGRGTIEFSGAVAQVETAFHTQMHHFLAGGELHLANVSAPQIPAALASVVAGVGTLHDFFKRPVAHSPRRLAAWESMPDYNAGDGSHYMAPGDFWTIYNATPTITAGTTGAGVTIGIVGRSDIESSDISTFRTNYLPGYANKFQQIINGTDPGDVSGDDIENTLDVEWSGATAPGASIQLVVSMSTETTDGVDLSAQYLVDKNIADVISASYGECEAELGNTENEFLSALWEQAAAEGITVAVSAGDNGSASCDDQSASGNANDPSVAEFGLQVSGLASTAYNVAVGGNEFYSESASWNSTMSSIPLPDTSAIGYIPEEVWNESCSPSSCGGANASLWAGSGGASNCISSNDFGACLAGWAKPSWQSGVYGIPSDGVRDLPDVSLSAASHDGYLLEFQGELYSVGGTSASAPAFAGVMALVKQKINDRLGQANYFLYQLAAKEYGSTGAPNTANLTSCNSAGGASVASTCVFYDVTTGSNAVPCAGGSPNCSAVTAGTYGMLSGYNAATGYDLATGIGSMNVTNLVNEWTSITGTILLTPASLIFSGRIVGTTSTAQSVTLEDSGTTALGTPNIAISGTNPGDFAATNTCKTSMGAGGSCSISVTFTPTATGSRTATLTVTDSNAGNSGQTVALSGTGVVLAGTIALTPGSLTFSGQLTDTLSTAQAVTLQNSGTAALAVPSVSISGANAGDFGLTNGCQSTLGVGSTCTIAVTFTPAASGSRTATLTVIDSNASNSPQTLALSGTGVAAVGTIALTPASLTFSSQTTGTTSTAQTVTVQNTGTAALAVPSVSISGSNANDFGLSNGCHASLSVGSSCVISLTFTPAATGSRTATLTVADSNASNSLQTVVLNGTGQDFSLSAATSSIVAITAGQSAAATVAVSAVDGFTGSITFTCAVPAAMTEASCSAAPVQIASGASSANSTVTINTTAAHHVSALRRHSSWIVAQWSLGFFGVFLWGIPCRRRKRIAFGAVLLATLLLSACGGGSGGGASSNSSGYTDTGTPAGTYVLTLTASSGAASHTMTLSATVQ